jgi:hypothetical protein
MMAIIFSPVDRTSAAAEVTSLTVGSLRATGIQVVVVSTELGELTQSERHPLLGDSLHWTDTLEVQRQVDASSFLVHQVDDDVQRFAGALYWLDRDGGIACVSETSGDGRPSTDQAKATRRAFIEWISRRASAVVVPSTAELALAQATCGGIVRVLKPPRGEQASTAQAEVIAHTRAGLVVLSHGETRPAATIDAVIQALASEPALAAIVEYRVSADLDKDLRNYFVSTAMKNGVTLVLLGALGGELLAAEIDAADVICQLQIPTSAAESRSLLYGLRGGTPLITARVAIPSDLPDGAVTIISGPGRVESLRQAFVRFSSEPDAARDAGKRGAAWASWQFQVDEYASGLRSVAEVVDGYNQSLVIATQWTRNLASWNVPPASPLLGELATTIGFFENSAATTAT